VDGTNQTAVYFNHALKIPLPVPRFEYEAGKWQVNRCIKFAVPNTSRNCFRFYIQQYHIQHCHIQHCHIHKHSHAIIPPLINSVCLPVRILGTSLINSGQYEYWIPMRYLNISTSIWTTHKCTIMPNITCIIRQKMMHGVRLRNCNSTLRARSQVRFTHIFDRVFQFYIFNAVIW
jgi:hypothetical protein